MDRPLFIGSLFFILGIILARFFTTWVALWLVLAGASFFAVLVFFFRQRKQAEEDRGYGVPILLLLCIVWLGGFWYSLSCFPAQSSSVKLEKMDQPVQGEGIIVSYPRENEYGISFQLAIKEFGQVIIKGAPGLGLSLAPGDRISFRGVLSLPRGARNPGEFNYREYLANQGIFYLVDCRKGGEMRLLEKGGGIRAFVAAGRKKVAEQIRTILPQREQSMILGTLFGDTTLIEDEEWEAYERTGVIHLFSVSGLHVGIVLGVVWFILSFWQPRPLVRLIFGSLVLLGYVLMVGVSSPILRAALMGALGMLALTAGRKYDFYNSLGAAAWLVLLLSPGELFQPGFQFSFLTTAGIVYLTPWLNNKGCGKVLSPVLAAHLMSSPIMAFHFNQVSLIGPLANLLAVAVSSFAAVLSFAAAFFTWFLPLLATPFYVVTGVLFFLLSELLIWCAGFQWASIWVASPSPLLISFIYLGLFLLPVYPLYRYIFREIPGKIRIALLCFLAGFFLLACWPVPRGMEVVFVDVGQGDSILVRTPAGKTILIDGGGTPGSTYSLGKNVLTPLLAHYGVNKIDLMIMSHNHVDHGEGLLEILPCFRVGAFWQPPGEENNEMEQAITEICLNNGIPRRELTAGQRIVLEQDVIMEVFHPDSEKCLDGNNRSLVIKLSYRESSWLFTGDIEKEALAQLLSKNASLRADVLKIPHHGSITSFDPVFYEKVQPGAVVISVGEKNNFGQPHPDVCSYFQSRGVPVYLTKEGGAIFTKSDGQKTLIRTFLQVK